MMPNDCQEVVAPYWNTKDECTSEICHRPLPCVVHDKFLDPAKHPENITSEVNHPSHYNQGKIEVIDAIEDWRLGFNLGNAVKYIARAKVKGQEVNDIRKAIWYLQRHLGENKKDVDKRA